MIASLATKKKLRTRNIHDGASVPPMRSSKKTRKSRGYSAKGDRYEVIICKNGFIDDFDKNHYGWFVGGVSTRKFNTCLQAINKLNGVIFQCGDHEASGKIHKSDIDGLLKIMAPWKKRKATKKKG